jgi:thymidylate synthase (FAD)
MKIVKPSFEVFEDLENPVFTQTIMHKLEIIGRTCYKSEENITNESTSRFVRNLIRNGHEAMLEHSSLTVKFIVDRGVSHELVRHRMASFAQESTRYCNYSNEKFGSEITVTKPCFYQEYSEEYDLWKAAMENAEYKYFQLLNAGSTPQEARSVLPNSLKTEIWMTANLREWRHVLKLRAAGTTGKPHPQMAEVMVPLLEYFKKYLPDVFFDIEVADNG